MLGQFSDNIFGIRLNPRVFAKARLKADGVLLFGQAQGRCEQARGFEALGTVAALVQAVQGGTAARFFFAIGEIFGLEALAGAVALADLPFGQAVISKDDVVVMVGFEVLFANFGESLYKAGQLIKLVYKLYVRNNLPSSEDVHHLVMHRARGGRGILREERNHDNFLHSLVFHLFQSTFDAGLLIAHAQYHLVFFAEHLLELVAHIEAIKLERRAALCPQFSIGFGRFGRSERRNNQVYQKPTRNKRKVYYASVHQKFPQILAYIRGAGAVGST